MEYSYTTLSQLTPVPSQCSIPPSPPSLSVERTSLETQQIAIFTHSVSLLSILLVVVYQPTIPHILQLSQVSALNVNQCMHDIHTHLQYLPMFNLISAYQIRVTVLQSNMLLVLQLYFVYNYNNVCNCRHSVVPPYSIDLF